MFFLLQSIKTRFESPTHPSLQEVAEALSPAATMCNNPLYKHALYDMLRHVTLSHPCLGPLEVMSMQEATLHLHEYMVSNSNGG